MCSECRMQYCHGSCPNACDEIFPVCCDCKETPYDKEVYVAGNGDLYCIDCVNAMDIDEILRICDISSPFELLELILRSRGENNKRTFVLTEGSTMTKTKNK